MDGWVILTPTSGSTYTHKPSEKTAFFWLYKERDDPTLVWKCNVHHFQPTKINCSKLFKLKTDGDSTHQPLTTASQRICQRSQNKAKQKSATLLNSKKSFRRYTSYEYVESILLIWEISSEHYKRGFSGPGQLGEFVEALFMWIWGLPLFSFMLHYWYEMSVHEDLQEDFLIVYLNLNV